MARPLRIEFDGAVYHVTSRGNERKDVFRDDKDRTAFLGILTKCCNLFHWVCHAYCLMNNHYHLVIETLDSTLSRGMRQLNGAYTQKFNWNHDRVGHLFQGRYKAVLIEKESHLLEACRYVVLNPIRAKMITAPQHWQWSSYRGTCGLSTPAACLTVEWVLQQFGSTRQLAIREYKKFVQDGIEAPSLWEDLRCQILLGDEAFIDKFSEVAKGAEELREIPRSQRFLSRPSLQDLFFELNNKQHRNELINEAVQAHGYSQKEVADHLRLHYATISRILAKNNGKTSRSKT
uniref:Transposase IS200-like domain-containing protein n=1 Tax=Geobacter sp. (strain M21) TaxID=443144 RepID=C6E226_GEOSM